MIQRVGSTSKGTQSTLSIRRVLSSHSKIPCPRKRGLPELDRGQKIEIRGKKRYLKSIKNKLQKELTFTKEKEE